MPQLREHPYIWTTWLPKLLTGETCCEWSVWFKAHYRDWSKSEGDFDQSEWLMRHTALLNQQKAERAGDNRCVYVEGQNAFRLRGKAATLAGRPDLVVLDDRDATVIDVKAGREQAWHRVQVMIYQYALPLVFPQFRDVRFHGEVVYPTRTVQIPQGSLSKQFIQELVNLIRRLGSDTPPGRAPSWSECRFCDISGLDCSERIDGDHGLEDIETDAF
ncbi:MAG: PD-(D/E)XK nuclease family protein [Chloroflexi bacterium]|nr:PD-(D/E)XK nuclease family protein [Chloroflexota bacterium]